MKQKSELIIYSSCLLNNKYISRDDIAKSQFINDIKKAINALNINLVNIATPNEIYESICNFRLFIDRVSERNLNAEYEDKESVLINLLQKFLSTIEELINLENSLNKEKPNETNHSTKESH